MSTPEVSREPAGISPHPVSPSDDLLAGESLGFNERVRLRASEFSSQFKKAQNEIGKVLVGMNEEVQLVLATAYIGGNVLTEGTPGLAKTLLANSVAQALGLDFKRIQFSPDLLPGDITGSLVQKADRSFEFRKGPIFSNIVLADEINRASPKTQSALLEAMQEKQVTVDGMTYPLPACFFVIATQNPLESSGTFPLPDAQMDRFSIKLDIKPSMLDELVAIYGRMTGVTTPKVNPIYSPDEAAAAILENRKLIRSVEVSTELMMKMAEVTVSLNPNHPQRTNVQSVTQNVLAGPSTRAGLSTLLLAKSFALLNGRMHVIEEDLKAAIPPCLRHRIVIRPEQMKPELTTDKIIGDVISAVFK